MESNYPPSQEQAAEVQEVPMFFLKPLQPFLPDGGKIIVPRNRTSEAGSRAGHRHRQRGRWIAAEKLKIHLCIHHR